jgi:CRP/FNR family cyclic AMP-dependent transcriptional regulator
MADTQVSDNAVRVNPELLDNFKDSTWGADKLQGIGMFQVFNNDELKRLYSHGEVKSFKAGSHVVIEGELSRGLYIVLKGSLSVFKSDPETGNLNRLAILDEGSQFGELSLLDNSPRSATVSAESNTHLFLLEHSAFENYLETLSPKSQVEFYKSCAQDLCERFRVLNGDYINAQRLLWKHALTK